MGCRSRPLVAARPSIVVMRSVDLICEIGTEHGLNFLPLMWLVQAWQTPMPPPYFGPLTPSRSRMTHSRRTSSSTSTRTRLPLRMKLWTGTSGSLPLLLRRLLAYAGLGQPVGRRLRDRRHGRERPEVQRLVVVERELRRRPAGRPSVGAGDGGHRRADAELADAAGLARGRRHHDDLDLRRRVPLAGVGRVVPAALEEVAVLEVEPIAERLRDAVHRAAHDLRLDAERVDRQPGVDGVDHLGHARPGVGVLDLAADRLRAAVDLDQARRCALVL